MSLPDAIATWLAGRHPAEAALCDRVARRLAEARLAGDTAVDLPADEVQRLLDCGAAATDPAVAPLAVSGRSVAWSACARDEVEVAGQLRRLAGMAATPATAAQVSGIDLGQDAAQDAAVRLAVERSLAVIVGGPGTGKTTTVLRALTALLAGGDRTVRLTAPTGKAAARLRAAVESGLDRVPKAARARLATAAAEATTLHRLLGWDVAAARFRHGPGRLLAADVVVVDEASMLDVHLAAALLRALPPQARLIIVGDDGQLPSVGSGAVLRDLVAGLPGSVARLATVHRQAGASAGLRALCPLLRSGDAAAAVGVLGAGHADAVLLTHALAWPLLRDQLAPWAESVVQAADPAAALAALARQLVLAATREGPWSVTDLHRRIEGLLGGSVDGVAPLPGHGRPLLITANDHRLGLSNGDVGILWDEDGHRLACFPDGTGGVRRFAPSRLPAHETGWVTTVHKAQGSEAPAVIAVLPPAPHPLASRELVYTAVTRARERVLLVGDEPLLQAALARREQRSTGLAARFSPTA